MIFNKIHGQYALLFQAITNTSITMRQQEMFEDVDITPITISNIQTVLDIITEQRDKERMLKWLASALTSDMSVSPMVRELVEGFAWAFVELNTDLVAYLYKHIEKTNDELRGKFLTNLALTTNGYIEFNLLAYTRKLINCHFNANKENSLYLQMIYALAVGAHHEARPHLFQALLEQERSYSIYLTVLEKVRVVCNKEQYCSIVYCSISSQKTLPVTKIQEGFIVASKNAINVLTWNMGRQRDASFINPDVQAITFFCNLTSPHPRIQLLEAWKEFDGVDMRAKNLRVLSKKLEESLPPGDRSVIATKENFIEIFPLVKTKLEPVS